MKHYELSFSSLTTLHLSAYTKRAPNVSGQFLRWFWNICFDLTHKMLMMHALMDQTTKELMAYMSMIKWNRSICSNRKLGKRKPLC